MKYFEIFGLKPSFHLDESELRKQFLVNSKKYHPDFHTLESEEAQEKILALSSLNNEAYKVLKDKVKRMAYILSEKGLIGEGVKNDLDQSFLMEMMEINEGMMELEFDYDEGAARKVIEEIDDLEKNWLGKALPAIKAHDLDPDGHKDYEEIKNFHLKRKYLLRIRENLDRFAGR